jgi:monooxygenase
MRYLRETVAENQLEKRIALGVRVLSADWDPTLRSWKLLLSLIDENGAKSERNLSCSMLYMCSGYFSYDSPHVPAMPGFSKFKGSTLHPQFWPKPSPSLGGKQVHLGISALGFDNIVLFLLQNYFAAADPPLHRL